MRYGSLCIQLPNVTRALNMYHLQKLRENPSLRTTNKGLVSRTFSGFKLNSAENWVWRGSHKRTQNSSQLRPTQLSNSTQIFIICWRCKRRSSKGDWFITFLREIVSVFFSSTRVKMPRSDIFSESERLCLFEKIINHYDELYSQLNGLKRQYDASWNMEIYADKFAKVMS